MRTLSARRVVLRSITAGAPREAFCKDFSRAAAMTTPIPTAHPPRRWVEGCRNAMKLFQEICELGYRGGRPMVAQFVSGWRKSAKASERDRDVGGRATT